MSVYAAAIMYVAFFALIAFAVYFTGSAMPLWALLLCPDSPVIKITTEKEK